MSVEVTSNPKTHADPRGRRLESWKEIAAYLGRDVTTVRRWEKREGLPVRRLQHSRLGSVYAYTAELDAWRNERAPDAATGGIRSTQVPQTVRRVGTVIAIAALGLAVVVGSAWLWRKRSTELATSASTRIRSLAVLPLENLSGNPGQDYLADGMTEALIGRLSAIQGLRVISRTSSMQFKGTRSSVPEIAKKLNVRAVVEGSVIRSGDRIRITAQIWNDLSTSCNGFSFFPPLEVVEVAVKEAFATVDHPDIRGSKPHNRDSSGAASDKWRGLVLRLSA